MKRAFIIALIISLLMLTFLNGCSRKVVNTKSLEKVDTETTQKAVISETTQDKTNINVVAESDELEISPIDNTKPVTINGKSYFNAKIKATKSKVNTNTLNDITTAKNAVIEAKVKENIVKQTKVKDSKKEDYSILYLMGIAIVLIAGYLYFKFK